MRGLWICGLALVVGGCATQGAEQMEIGRVVSRDRTVVIETGEKGVVYSVQGKDGKVVVKGATLAELKVQDPRMGRMMETGVAWAGE